MHKISALVEKFSRKISEKMERFRKIHKWKSVLSEREKKKKKKKCSVDRYRCVLHGVKNRASSTVEQSPSTLEPGCEGGGVGGNT